jgi:hypothetical protein
MTLYIVSYTELFREKLRVCDSGRCQIPEKWWSKHVLDMGRAVQAVGGNPPQSSPPEEPILRGDLPARHVDQHGRCACVRGDGPGERGKPLILLGEALQ